MGRPGKQAREPYWLATRNCYFVHVGSRTIRLSPDKDEAYRLWHELMARPPEKRSLPGPNAPAVEIIDAFLEWCQVNRDRLTYEAYRRRLQAFVNAIPPAIGYANLKPNHVTRVMDAHAGWNANTKNDFATAVQRAFNWALSEGLIERNPLARVTKPGREPRELAVSPADYAEVMAAVAEPNFRSLLTFAWESGVRPQGIVKIEARHVNFALERIVLPPKEAKGKKRHRIIYLTDEGIAVLMPLVEARPAGPLFRNSDGAPWNKDSINCAFCRLRVRLAERLMEREGHAHRTLPPRVPKEQIRQACADRRAAVTAWKEIRARFARERVPRFHLGAWRKGYATEALKAGVNVIGVATLLGHSNSVMLAKVYAKLQQDPEYMAEQANKAKKPRKT